LFSFPQPKFWLICGDQLRAHCGEEEEEENRYYEVVENFLA
jgi:hypothetical protein